MLPLLQFGQFTSPPALLVGLVALAIVLLLGRVVMKVAWRLVILAILAVTALWVLAMFGIQLF